MLKAEHPESRLKSLGLLQMIVIAFVVFSPQFLKRNPSQRIGGGPGDAADVQVKSGNGGKEGNG